MPGSGSVPLLSCDNSLLDRAGITVTATTSDKSTEIIYYCGGYDCPLSSKSAAKAMAQGYTNVKLFQAGYPAWKQAYGASEAPAQAAASASGAPKIETGTGSDGVSSEGWGGRARRI